MCFQELCFIYDIRYGQTGSGKTYTMEGPPGVFTSEDSTTWTERGVIPRAMDQVFNHVAALKQHQWSYHLQVSFVEVNEFVIDEFPMPPDLLRRSTRLIVR